MSNNGKPSPTHCIGLAFGALLLRLWVGMRLFFAGLDKWKTKVTETVTEKLPDADGVMVEQEVEKTFWKYDLGNAEVYNTNIGYITNGMNNDSPLRLWMIESFGSMLGWMLIITGAWILIGLFSRAALVAGGFVFLSLTFGLATIGADPQIVERGIEIAICVGAIALARYQVFGVDGLIRLALGGDRGQSSDDSGDSSSSSRKKD